MTHHDLIGLIDHPERLNEDTFPAVERLVRDYPYFQTARLLYVFNMLAVKDTGFSSELKKAAFYAGDRKVLFYKLTGNQFAFLQEKLKRELSLKGAFSLIDSFLQETGESYIMFPDYLTESVKNTEALTPTPSYRLEKEDSAGKPAATLKHQDIIDQFLEKDEKESIRFELEDDAAPAPPPKEEKEDSPFFSETLAKIYIKQRKYDKAIEIIRKLSLLYPEKSVYFADQIRFLNKLNINAKK